MINTIKELTDTCLIINSHGITCDYKITNIMSLRIIYRPTPSHYLLINNLPVFIQEAKVIEIIKTLILSELMELQSKYKEDKIVLDEANILFNDVTLN